VKKEVFTLTDFSLDINLKVMKQGLDSFIQKIPRTLAKVNIKRIILNLNTKIYSALMKISAIFSSDNDNFYENRKTILQNGAEKIGSLMLCEEGE